MALGSASSAASSMGESDSQMEGVTNGVKHVTINGDTMTNGKQEQEEEKGTAGPGEFSGVHHQPSLRNLIDATRLRARLRSPGSTECEPGRAAPWGRRVAPCHPGGEYTRSGPAPGLFQRRKKFRGLNTV